MSTPHLPAELLDHVVDYLHDTKHALRNCCLVSKSWIPRTRTHLFANVLFRHEQDLESWRETFPDPSTSPARYTETLRVHCLHIATAADAKPGGWIRGFSRVVHLKLSSYDGLEVSLLPFHGFSPVIKSLYVGFDVFPSSPIFDLILSFPLLEDLTVHTHRAETNDGDGPDGFPTTIRPPNPPMFTGSLELAIPGVTSITRQLVSLPSGIHFRKFTVTWDREADILPITALVERCSHTLESLSISCESFAGSTALDLSKVTKLQDVAFQLTSLSVEWITMAIQTITPKHRDLLKISIHVAYFLIYFDVDAIKNSAIYGEWLALDRLLVRFWESRLTPPKVICTRWNDPKQDMRPFTECLLPELTRKGMVGLCR